MLLLEKIKKCNLRTQNALICDQIPFARQVIICTEALSFQTYPILQMIFALVKYAVGLGAEPIKYVIRFDERFSVASPQLTAIIIVEY